MTDLSGRTAVVTGASRGIGLAVAERLVAAGAGVVLLARSADDLRAAAERLGPTAMTTPCDVSDPNALARVSSHIVEMLDGGPDILVNNAGRFVMAPVTDIELEDFRETLETNLVAPFALVRAFLPAMRERRRGHVVTIGSIADRVAFAENAAYSASKYGVRGLHEVLRAELRGTGIRATLVSPGPVDTDIWNDVDPDSRPGFTPRASMLRPDAVAAAVLFAVTQPADVTVDELRLSRS